MLRGLGPAPLPTPTGDLIEDVPEGPWYRPVIDTLTEASQEFLARLPFIVLGVVLLAVGVVVARAAGRGMERLLRLTVAERGAERLLVQMVRLTILAAFVLWALAVAGVNVGVAVAGVGLVGVAVALAAQSMLENFVAGVLLIVRKPFRAGDQVRTNEFEGTIEEVDLRVTRLLTYDGEVVVIPNADVFRSSIVNLTRRGRRRTRVTVSVDYRDDHDAAREVIRDAVAGTQGVLPAPEPEVLLLELGESSVNFEVRYWTLPDIGSVLRTQDRVLAAAKRAIQEAGMTIPWPIRTLHFDNAVDVRPDGQVQRRAER